MFREIAFLFIGIGLAFLPLPFMLIFTNLLHLQNGVITSFIIVVIIIVFLLFSTSKIKKRSD